MDRIAADSNAMRQIIDELESLSSFLKKGRELSTSVEEKLSLQTRNSVSDAVSKYVADVTELNEKIDRVINDLKSAIEERISLIETYQSKIYE